MKVTMLMLVLALAGAGVRAEVFGADPPSAPAATEITGGTTTVVGVPPMQTIRSEGAPRLIKHEVTGGYSWPPQNVIWENGLIELERPPMVLYETYRKFFEKHGYRLSKAQFRGEGLPNSRKMINQKAQTAAQMYARYPHLATAWCGGPMVMKFGRQYKMVMGKREQQFVYADTLGTYNILYNDKSVVTIALRVIDYGADCINDVRVGLVAEYLGSCQYVFVKDTWQVDVTTTNTLTNVVCRDDSVGTFTPEFNRRTAEERGPQASNQVQLPGATYSNAAAGAVAGSTAFAVAEANANATVITKPGGGGTKPPPPTYPPPGSTPGGVIPPATPGNNTGKENRNSSMFRFGK